MVGIHIDQYITLVLQSNLVKVSELEAALKRIPAEGGASSEERLEALSKELAAAKLVTPWQDGVLRSGQPRSFFLGKYRLLNQLAQEQPLKTYLAEAGSPPRKCLVKLFPPKRMRDDSVFRQDVLADAKQALTLHHPGLLRTLSIETLEPIVFQVSEYFPGKNLEEVIAEAGPLPLQAVVRIGQQVAEALVYLHARGVVHHRIRPANLRLGPGGKIKLGGLGGWRFEDAASAGTKPGSSEGSGLDRDLAGLGVAYWAPEELNGPGGPESDLYGLGAAMVFLLTGKPLFEAASAPELFEKIHSEVPPPVRPAKGEAPPDFRTLLARLLAKDPVDRIPTAAELLRLLGGGTMADGGSSILARGFGSGDPESSEAFSLPPASTLGASGSTATSPIALAAASSKPATADSSMVLDLSASAAESSLVVADSRTSSKSSYGSNSSKSSKSSKAKSGSSKASEADDEEEEDEAEDARPQRKKGSNGRSMLMTASLAAAAVLLVAVVGAVIYASQRGAPEEDEVAAESGEPLAASGPREKLTEASVSDHLAEWKEKSKEAAAKAIAEAKANAFTPQGSLPKSVSVRASQGAVELLNDGDDALAVLTDRKGQVWKTSADHFSGGSALVVENGEAGKAAIPGLMARIGDTNKDGSKFRYLAFTWRAEGEGPFTVEVASRGKFMNCSKNAGFMIGKPNPPNKIKRLSTNVPSLWTEVVVDLAGECGDFDFTGIKFKAEKGKLFVDAVGLSRWKDASMFTGAPDRAWSVLNDSFNEVRAKSGSPQGIPLVALCGAREEFARRMDGFGLDEKNTTAVSNWSAPWTHCRTQTGTVDGRGAPLEMDVVVPKGWRGRLVVFCIDASKKGRKQKVFVDGKELGVLEKFEGGKRLVATIDAEASKDGRIALKIEPQTGESPVVSLLALYTTAK